MSSVISSSSLSSKNQQINNNNNTAINAENNTNNNESNTTVSLPRTPIAANVRFMVALAVLITQGFALLFCQTLFATSSTILYYFSVFFTIFITFFSSEWIRIHSFALTRQKRAFFDESNILETYQPRSRTHGHLFQPDPPTPGPTML
uniref:Transmembrane protein n=1 Tax=Panagrolaimus superbus TaxID=310955 RepID=A0A914YDJ9_9BILA